MNEIDMSSPTVNRRGMIVLGFLALVCAVAISVLLAAKSSDPQHPITAQTLNYLTPFPTETDLLAERRAEASEFAESSPEFGDPNTVIPKITQYLSDEDPVVRSMGAAAIQRIAWTPEGTSSGLFEAVQDDQTLIDALYATVSYVHNSGFDLQGITADKDMRAEAVKAIGVLGSGPRRDEVESVLVDRYGEELATNVRRQIVAVLCELNYTSSAAEAVVEEATAEDDAELAQLAQACKERLFPE